jgi:hypothetical protein
MGDGVLSEQQQQHLLRVADIFSKAEWKWISCLCDGSSGLRVRGCFGRSAVYLAAFLLPARHRTHWLGVPPRRKISCVVARAEMVVSVASNVVSEVFCSSSVGKAGPLVR